jgi:hypothetical protein
MDIGKPLMAVFLGIMTWLMYAGLTAVIPRQIRTCCRIGKTFIWKSLLNGVVAYIAVLAVIFGVILVAKTPGILFYVGAAALITLAGSSIGLLLVGGLFNLIDAEAHPYKALAAGIVIVGCLNAFSTAGQVIAMLVGAYGIGTIVLYLRGAALDLSALPEASASPAAFSGIKPLQPGALGVTPAFQAGPVSREAGSSFRSGDFLLAALAVAAFFVGMHYSASLEKISTLFKTVEETAPAPAPLPASRGIPVPPLSDVSEPAEDKTAPAAVKTAPPTELEKKVAELEMPIVDLEARMWAYRIQEGEFTLKELKSDAEGWIVTEDYKTVLFWKMDKLLKAGPVQPLTKAEHQTLDAVKEKMRQLLRR